MFNKVHRRRFFLFSNVTLGIRNHLTLYVNREISIFSLDGQTDDRQTTDNSWTKPIA